MDQVYSAVGLEKDSWKTDVLVFVQMQQDKEDYGWKMAEHAAYMVGRYGRGTASKLAGAAGVSASYIRSLAATVRAFPEGQRNRQLTVSHHRIAARTGTPRVWLERAGEKKWSVRELQKAVRDGHPEHLEDYRTQVEQLENTVKKFNAVWGTSRNVKAVLVWESLGGVSFPA